MFIYLFCICGCSVCVYDMLDQRTTCLCRFSPCEFRSPSLSLAASSLSCWAMQLAQEMLSFSFSSVFHITPGSYCLVGLCFSLWNLYYTSLELLSCRWHCCLIPGDGCLWLHFLCWMGIWRESTVEHKNSEWHLESIDFNETPRRHLLLSVSVSVLWGPFLRKGRVRERVPFEQGKHSTEIFFWWSYISFF